MIFLGVLRGRTEFLQPGKFQHFTEEIYFLFQAGDVFIQPADDGEALGIFGLNLSLFGLNLGFLRQRIRAYRTHDYIL
jgi:hypothetical protein